MSTFPNIVHERGLSQPDRIACRFFKGASLIPEDLSFGELWRRSSALAQRLQAMGLRGERAVLVCKSQATFVEAFYACLLAGVVAVPTAPPRRQVLQSRLQLIVGDAQARALLFDADELLQAELHEGGEALIKIDLREPSDAFVSPAEPWRPVSPEADAPAFLQYTSGSTGDPKGVIVTHGNLIDNCASIREAMEINADSVLFTALPLFHDMGLVGGVLQLMYSGCSAGFMSPAEFVQYPERWLQIISRYRVTVSGGPNFMYELAAGSVGDEQLQGVDLSCWRVAFCGAEPIKASTIERFGERYGAYGFDAGAFYPCYGMAESTLFITGTSVGQAPRLAHREGARVVGCGHVRGDVRLEIVDPDTQLRVRAGEVGEIWVSSASVARGYWRRPELSARIFGARIEGGEEAYLRTGDLGFISDGQLYIAGRLKDLIIVSGRKYAPQDIEHECERSHGALRQAGGAAFSIEDGGRESVVVVFELKREWLRRRSEWDEVARAMRAGVSAAYGLPLSEVVLIAPGSLPRTSSGKVRRAQCRMDYLAGVWEPAVEV